MNHNLQKIQRIIRDFGLLKSVEKLRYLVSVVKNHKENNKFIRNNPGFITPPAILAYDAYSAPDWFFYKKSGEETARFLSVIANKYLPNSSDSRLLE